MLAQGIKITRSWKSRLGGVGVFLFLCGLVAYLSQLDKFRWSLLFKSLPLPGGYLLEMALPVLCLLPLTQLVLLLWYVYEAVMLIDVRGVEMRRGLLAKRQKVSRVRFEEISVAEVKQTRLEKILGVGGIQIKVAPSNQVALVMQGIATPKAVQMIIQSERDRRAKMNANRKPASQPLAAAANN